MNLGGNSQIPEILKNRQSDLLTRWLQEQQFGGIRNDLIKEAQLREECREFLDLLTQVTQQGNLTNIQALEWREIRDLLASIFKLRMAPRT